MDRKILGVVWALGRILSMGFHVVALLATISLGFATVRVELIDPSPSENANAWLDEPLFEYREPVFAFARLP